MWFDYFKGQIHLWEQVDGVDLPVEPIDWVPYVFLKTNKSDIKSMYGDFVVKKTFKTYKDYKDFTKQQSAFEDKIKPEIQFLVDRYYGISDDEMAERAPTLKIYYLDLEIHRPQLGFPKPSVAEDPVSLISICDHSSGKITTFGLKPFKSNLEDSYYYCATEKELLQKFLGFMKRYPCDVLSGWNIRGFDLPYLYNRIINLFGKNTRIYNAMSPAGNVNVWTKTGGDLNIDLAGISILDYMELYKLYSAENLESYSLQFVSNFELGAGKFDYSKIAEDLKELYDKDWNAYVEYNKIDVRRVQQLEEKKGFIKLVQGISLFSKCPMKFCDKQTPLIEAAMLTYLRRHNLCAPAMPKGSTRDFEAAIVKEPLVGKYEWVIDADITSSYPSHIITLNMSNESYYGRIMNFSEDEIINFTIKKEFPEFTMRCFDTKAEKWVSGKYLKAFNNSVRAGLLTISPIGVIFKSRPSGCFADVERALFAHRKEIKDKMMEYSKAGKKIKAIQMKNSQIAVKTTLNGIYGAFSVIFSRYFNLDIAEAITSCGRHTLRRGMKFVNDLGNTPNEELVSILKELKS
ncbi:MAG: 3'-5' exonuclease [Candidatus Shapirobacteria bacterium]